MATDARRLSFLLAVHRAGGVLAAADLLHVTPSAVSQQIARLEKEEGVTVLDRGPRGVTLTPAGRVLAEAAERIEGELVSARKELAALGDDVAGTVTVASFETITVAVLVPALVALKELHPGVDIVLKDMEYAEGVRSLRAGEVDIVLHERDEHTKPNAGRGQRDIPVLDEPWRLAVPASMPTPGSLHELAGVRWVGPDPGTAAARALGRLGEEIGAEPIVRHSFYEFGVALALVAAGEGVALLPALALRAGVPDGVEVVTMPGLGTRRIVARHRHSRHEPGPAVAAALEAIGEAAASIDLP
ncbi:LysR family transcriptional regulator [Sanguibacter sp. A247]|uniref:LysR family transcriptional regulator n=1 Tax=unclassified Sanguibacter TaxID=2645534 RepID=UPI003FD796A5